MQVGSDEQQLYLTFTVLLKHSTAQSLGLADLERLSVAKTACEEGLRLPGVLSSAALVASIKVISQHVTPSRLLIIHPLRLACTQPSNSEDTS